MGKWLLGLAIVLLIVLASSACAAQLSWTGTCVGVHDGDTITVTHGSDVCRIRLAGIDAPEIAQAGGQQAKDALAALVLNRAVCIYTTGTDRYGRFVGWVFCGGTRVNLMMVASGNAWWYRQYAPDNVALSTAEASARTAHIGIWSQTEAPIAPWDYRHAEEARAADAADQGTLRWTTPLAPQPSFAAPYLAPPSPTHNSTNRRHDYDPGKTETVRGYIRDSGRYVAPYVRHPAGTAPPARGH